MNSDLFEGQPSDLFRCHQAGEGFKPCFPKAYSALKTLTKACSAVTKLTKACSTVTKLTQEKNSTAAMQDHQIFSRNPKYFFSGISLSYPLLYPLHRNL